MYIVPKCLLVSSKRAHNYYDSLTISDAHFHSILGICVLGHSKHRVHREIRRPAPATRRVVVAIWNICARRLNLVDSKRDLSWDGRSGA